MTNKQTILITGATGNIGGGAAVALAKRGARVVLLGRKPERLAARAGSIRAALSEEGIEGQDADIATLAFDFSDMASVRLAAAEALDRFPVIDGLVLSVVALGTVRPAELRSILEPGGARDAAKTVQDFLGRPHSFEAYRAWLAR